MKASTCYSKLTFPQASHLLRQYLRDYLIYAQAGYVWGSHKNVGPRFLTRKFEIWWRGQRDSRGRNMPCSPCFHLRPTEERQEYLQVGSMESLSSKIYLWWKKHSVVTLETHYTIAPSQMQLAYWMQIHILKAVSNTRGKENLLA